jgi:hypothetical protein
MGLMKFTLSNLKMLSVGTETWAGSIRATTTGNRGRLPGLTAPLNGRRDLSVKARRNLQLTSLLSCYFRSATTTILPFSMAGVIAFITFHPSGGEVLQLRQLAIQLRKPNVSTDLVLIRFNCMDIFLGGPLTLLIETHEMRPNL